MIQADQPTIFDPVKVRAFVSSRADGNMKYEQGPDAATNIAAFAHTNQLDVAQVVVMYVNDPDRWDVIYDATAKDAGAGVANPETRIHADAIVTTIPGLSLLLPIADCCPVIMHDPVKGVIALVHLGWQSAEANLLPKVIAHMQQTYGSLGQDLLVYMGPCIRPESYVFGDRPRQADNAAWQAFVAQQDDGWHIDIPGYVHAQLQAAGVPETHIQMNQVNTATADDYFSHYVATKGGEAIHEGRFVAVVQKVL